MGEISLLRFGYYL